MGRMFGLRTVLSALVLAIPSLAYASAGAAQPSVYFEVDANGVLSFSSAPRELVAAVLPNYLELMPQSLTAPDRYPIVLWMYEFSNTKLVTSAAPGDPLPTLDLAVMIPWVRFSGSNRDCVHHQRGPFVFTSIYYTQKPWVGVLNAVVNEAPGLPALFDFTPGHFRVTSILGEPLVDARYSWRGSTIARIPRALENALSRPLIGWSGSLGAYVYGHRVYRWQGTAKQPVVVDLSVPTKLDGLEGSLPPWDETISPMREGRKTGAVYMPKLHASQETYYCSNLNLG
jgi:hypothetical protein